VVLEKIEPEGCRHFPGIIMARNIPETETDTINVENVNAM